MIFSLEGTVTFKALHYIVVDVGGVGYRVFVGSETLKKIPSKGKKLKLKIKYLNLK